MGTVRINVCSGRGGTRVVDGVLVGDLGCVRKLQSFGWCCRLRDDEETVC